MSKYLLKCFSFFLLLILVLAINKVKYNAFYGGKLISCKINDFESKNVTENFNTVFIGSSHILNQINPIGFDSYCNKKVPIKSYNLGFGGCFAFEQMYVLENFIKSEKAKNVENVFIELQKPKRIDDVNALAIRTHYYLNFNTLKRLFRLKKYKYEFYKNYLIGGLLNIFNYRSTFYSSKLTKNLCNERINNNNGFSGLTESMNERIASGHFGLAKRHKNYLKNKKNIINERRLKQKKKLHKSNYDYLDEIVSIATKYNEKKFYIVYHPLTYQLGIKKYKNLTILNLNKSDNKKLLTNHEFHFDQGHLNDKGAKIFTKLIAKKFLNASKN